MISIGPPGGSSTGGRRKLKKKRTGRPVAVICYICGRQYGRSSLGIHLRQCKKLWNQREALKPEYERKQLPTPPENFERAIASGDIEHMDERAINAQNTAAFDSYNTEALDSCPHCGRSFLAEPLKIHMRSCRPGRLIGEKLKAHSGKAGGNLGLKADPRSRARPGSAPRPNQGSGGGRNKRAERIPIRERMAAAMQERAARGSGRAMAKHENTYEVLEPPRTAPSSSTSSTKPSAFARSGALQMQTSSGQNQVQGQEQHELGYERREVTQQEKGSEGGSSCSSNNNNNNSAGQVQEQWHEAWDPKSGRDFYYNNKGETRWTLPKGSRDNAMMMEGLNVHVLDKQNTRDVTSTKSTPVSNSKRISNRAGSSSIERKLESGSGGSAHKHKERRQHRGEDNEDTRVQVLEDKVANLEDKLDWAVGEIERLSSKLKKFYKAFED
jgi:hypothetical protein